MKNGFVDVRSLDNFYQTSSFYPMPVILVTTLSESGLTNIGPYSLCFPFGIADQHAMMLISRYDSNTATNIRRTKYAALNFIPFNKHYLKNAVTLGFPGQTTEKKLEESKFSLFPSQLNADARPQIINESIQVFECTWDDSSKFHYSGTPAESHFLLRIEKILMKKKWYDCLLTGKGFPSLPIDYGFRDNTKFWFSEHKPPYPEPMPKGKGTSVNTVRYQAERIDPDIVWAEESFEQLVNIPRIFLKKALTGIVAAAKEKGITEITPEVLAEIRDKRNAEKK